MLAAFCEIVVGTWREVGGFSGIGVGNGIGMGEEGMSGGDGGGKGARYLLGVGKGDITG